MVCDACDIKVEGRFAAGAFAKLNATQLQFIQLFIHCEGSIREMEKALGVSYPTVKAKLADVKAALAAGADTDVAQSAKPRNVASILAELQAGGMSFEEALKEVRNLTNQQQGE